MLAAAVLLAACLLALTVVPRLLAAARWPARSPGRALQLWQALGLSGGLLALELLLTRALAPVGEDHLDGVRRAWDAPSRLPWWSWLALAAFIALLLRLLSVLLASTARTLLARRRHRCLVDLVTTPAPTLRGTRVVDHAVPVAYCLPGLRSRVVLSQGVLALLAADEVEAVLAHERAHLTQRHDLVVLPFVALGATFPRLPPVRTAQAEVALLVEMLADDVAVRRHDRAVLAAALAKVGGGAVPPGGLGAAGPAVLRRRERLLQAPDPLTRAAALAVHAATVGVLLLPLAGVLAAQV
ncbi:MAG: M56 family metallopeptidase [Mycobacteriales bacterium]|nr:M56 family metallopeptidase [Mycobacteriales bacterium]